jgi:hypothetical protein
MKQAALVKRFCKSLTVPTGRLAGRAVKLAPYQNRFIDGAFADGVNVACPLRANKSETIEWLKFTLEGVGERTHGYAFEDTAF